jgi:peptidoglycan biosynthesis protein MviN/MurJ (putative lipid II flippase)
MPSTFSARRPWHRVILISVQLLPGVAIGWWLDPHFGARSLVGLAIGTLVGGAWQLAGQFPSLWRVGYKYHADFQWRDEGVRTVLTLMGPAVIAASAVQVNVLINSGFAASLGNGPVSWLNIAFRLMQLPLGIFGVAIGTVTLPLVSKSAAVGNMGRVPHDSRSWDKTRIFAHHSFGNWAGDVCLAHYQRDLPTRAV